MKDKIVKKSGCDVLENPTFLFFYIFVTTEMLKHFNTEKSMVTSLLASFFFPIFFSCLANTEDDIARHIENSS